MPKITVNVWNTPPIVMASQELADKIRREPENFPDATQDDRSSFRQAVQHKIAMEYRIEPGDVSVKLKDRLLSRSHVSSEAKKEQPKKGERPLYIDSGSAPVWIRIETSMVAVCRKTVERIVRDELVKVCGIEVYILISANALEIFLTTFCNALLKGKRRSKEAYNKFNGQLELMKEHAETCPKRN